MKHHLKFAPIPALVAGILFLAGCGKRANVASYQGEPNQIATVIAQRNLTPDDVFGAVSTYEPSGQHDEYVMFASGGQSGQVLVYGIPSMRLLDQIPVFTPDSMAGWGYGGAGNAILHEADLLAGPTGPAMQIRWGDTHHPALSQTNAKYDGKYLFINDKANGRLAVVNLHYFQTTQIVKNPIFYNDHGATFVTPNTRYIIETSQYAAPLGESYAPLQDYATAYRGEMTFWRFDEKTGYIDTKRSFAIELPPYWQDLAIAGRLASHGWVFCNSFNVAMFHGNDTNGKPSFEVGATQRDTDYLHIIHLAQAEADFNAGKFTRINGFPVIPLKTAIADNILYFTPETKSPHGVDATPDGKYIVVSGKLDPHVSVYSFKKILAAITAGNYRHDQYVVPVLPMRQTIEARVEVGLGPLHTQFDNKGYAYTSLFLDSAIAKWSLGGNYEKLHPSVPAWTLVQKLPVNYNPGHLAAPASDTAQPLGHYLVSLNKWSIDRFNTVGPLYPEDLQLVDISGPKMRLLSDTPLGVGEIHYAEIIPYNMLNVAKVYPMGFSPRTGTVSKNAVQPGHERIVRQGNHVTIFMTAVRSHYTPEVVQVNQGDDVTWHITNIERTPNATHGLAVSAYNVNLTLNPGETETVHFVASRAGVFSFYCTKFCSALHLEMAGYLVVKPTGTATVAQR
jgi:nitrous-oxide reductase